MIATGHVTICRLKYTSLFWTNYCSLRSDLHVTSLLFISKWKQKCTELLQHDAMRIISLMQVPKLLDHIINVYLKVRNVIFKNVYIFVSARMFCIYVYAWVLAYQRHRALIWNETFENIGMNFSSGIQVIPSTVGSEKRSEFIRHVWLYFKCFAVDFT